MAKSLHVSIADVVFNDIEKNKPNSIGRSEFVEELIRNGLQHHKKKEGDNNEDNTEPTN